MEGKRTILFINKDAKSINLSRSEGVEQSQIFSHVQTGAKKAVSRKALTINGMKSSRAKHAASPTLAASSQIQTRKGSRVLEFEVRETDFGLYQVSLQHDLLPSPFSDLRLSDVDPFGSPDIATRRYMDVLLRFFSSDLAEKMYDAKCVVKASQDHTLSLAVEDPILLNTLLCTTSGAVFSETQDSRHLYSSIGFKNRAIGLLQNKLQSAQHGSIGVSSIYAISLLLWTECVNGSTDDLQAHARGLDYLVESTSGIREASLMVTIPIFAFSYLCAAMLGTCPQLAPPASTTPEEPLLDFSTLLVAEYPDLARIASSFFSPCNRELIGPSLLHLLSTHQKCVQFKGLCNLGAINPEYHEAAMSYGAMLDTEYSLLSMPFKASIHGPCTPAQSAISLALFVVRQPIITIMKPCAFGAAVAQRLRGYIEQTDISTTWSQSKGLLLWVSFLGVFLTKHQKGTWFQDMMYRVVEEMQLESCQAVEDILHGYYFFSQHFDATLSTAWQKIEYRRLNDPI